ncbi:Asp23/Gls24 family envelope stress response protein [Olsenella sp. Marseille-QA0557]|uniref:Asp23/Gls24 family envelope stress response protein n=1 Tax=Candidatus Coprovicinus avistercoris TaxID=2840754 RepID=A0A9D1HVR4_9ACTN|nr:Asp23/Gls24 family envelope stress response protein [Candidatus Coprovicinus avistercoris]
MTQAIPGTLRVSNDCISDLAGYAAMQCYGVVGMAFTDADEGVTRLLPTAGLRKGIDVSQNENGLIVDMHVIVEQGVNMSSVAKNLSDAVCFLLKSIAELEDVDVHVHIEGMRVH